jgi:hypothetical protein
MASKFIRGLSILATLFFITAWACPSSVASDKNLKKHYTSRTQADGVLYHIFSPSKYIDKAANGDFEFDITHFSASDSITLNFSWYAKQPTAFKYIEWTTQSHSIKTTCNRLFVDKVKKEWNSRYSSKIHFDEFSRLLNSTDGVEISFGESDSIQKIQLKGKTWENHKKIIADIFHLIQLNR